MGVSDAPIRLVDGISGKVSWDDHPEGISPNKDYGTASSELSDHGSCGEI